MEVEVWRVAVVHHQQEHNNALLTNIIIRTEVSPARCLSVKTAGGGKVVNARMEEPGGGWRRRIPDKFFNFHTIFLPSFLVRCGLAAKIGYVPVFSRGEEGSCICESESLVHFCLHCLPC